MTEVVLDDWQKEVMATKGNICLRSGRQVGKSFVISHKVGEYAVNNRNKTVLVIASVERQSQLLFEKILSYLHNNHRTYIKKGKDKPTKSKLCLNNGTTIYCLPTGLSGYGIRGYTVDLLVADEAAFIPEEVWTAVTPMIAITRGTIIMLSTPFGRGGYFYDCFHDPSYTSFHVSSEDCPRKNQEFLDREKSRMSDLQYAQEYLGEFVDELRQFFPTELIKSCMTLEGGLVPLSTLGDNFLGVDVARMGGDETVLVSIKRNPKKTKLRQIDMNITRKSFLTDTVRLIKNHDAVYNYKKIYIDDGGLGVGVFDPLLEDPQTKRKVVPINNSSRSLDKESKRSKKLLKEDLYTNLLVLMQRGKVELFDNPEIFQSLKSVQAEYKDGKLKLFGKYTHICEALIRAAWCMKDKSLNIWIA
jgi:hypothetical protein